MFQLSERNRWLLIAGEAVSTSWRLAAGDEPPEDPNAREFTWTSALIFSAAAGAIIGVSELVARRGAGAAWKQATGKRPPRGRKKTKRRGLKTSRR